MISGERDTVPGMPAPAGEWRRQLRVKDYTAEETEYIHSIWERAVNTFQSVDRGKAIDGGQSSAVTNIARHLSLRPRADSRAAQTERSIGSTTSTSTKGRVKKRAYVRTTPQSPVTARGESRVVSSDRGRTRERRRKPGMPGGQIEAAHLDVPLSPATGRMLLGQVRLSSRFLSETCVPSCIFSAQVNLRLNKLFLKGCISLMWTSRLAEHFTRYVPLVASHGGSG